MTLRERSGLDHSLRLVGLSLIQHRSSKHCLRPPRRTRSERCVISIVLSALFDSQGGGVCLSHLEEAEEGAVASGGAPQRAVGMARV